MDAFEILVIILSVLLAIVLILSVIALVYLVKVIIIIKKMTEKASSAVENVGSVAAGIGKFITPAAAGKFVVTTLQKVVKNHQAKRKEK